MLVDDALVDVTYRKPSEGVLPSLYAPLEVAVELALNMFETPVRLGGFGEWDYGFVLLDIDDVRRFLRSSQSSHP
jgi:hypothetical protein